jgi:acid stress chaperone HdeB
MLHSEAGTSANRNSIKFVTAAIAVAVLAGCAVAVPPPAATSTKAPRDLELACGADRKCPNGAAEHPVASARSHSATGGKIATVFAAPAKAKVQKVATTFAPPADPEVQKIDVSAMTCRQFLQTGETNNQVILAWFLGFYSEVENPQIIDLGNLDKLRDKLLTLCKDQPQFRMTTAAEGILGK